MVKIDSEKAKQILSDVPEQNYFITKEGKTIKNITELSELLKEVNEEVFSYHVNEERNDFSNWIKDVIKDTDLAKSMINHIQKERMQETVEKRIKRLNWIKENPISSSDSLLINKTEEEIKEEVNERIKKATQNAVQKISKLKQIQKTETPKQAKEEIKKEAQERAKEAVQNTTQNTTTKEPSKQENKIEEDARELTLETIGDEILQIVKNRKRISLKECSEKLKVPQKLIEQWAESLEEEGFMSIEWKLSTPYLINNEKTTKTEKQNTPSQGQQIIRSCIMKQTDTKPISRITETQYIIQAKLKDYLYGIIIGTIAGVTIGILL